MTLRLYAYSAAYPVLGALKARALTEGLVEGMLRAGSFDAGVKMLVNAVGSSPRANTPLDVEDWLWAKWESDAKELARFMRGNLREFPLLFVAKADVRKLKVKAREFLAREEVATAFPRRRSVLLRDERLEGVKTSKALLRAVAGTPLQHVLARALSAISGEEGFLRFELTLEAGYEHMLNVGLMKLGEEGTDAHRELFEEAWALRDLLKALRLRFGYGMPAQEIFHYVAFASPQFPASHFWKAMEKDIPEECLRALPKGGLSQLLTNLNAYGKSVAQLELLARKHSWQRARARRIGNPFAMVTFLKYLMWQELLTEDAVTALAAKRFGLPDDQVRPMLAFTPGD